MSSNGINNVSAGAGERVGGMLNGTSRTLGSIARSGCKTCTIHHPATLSLAPALTSVIPVVLMLTVSPRT